MRGREDVADVAVRRAADEPLVHVVDEHLVERGTGLGADVEARGLEHQADAHGGVGAALLVRRSGAAGQRERGRHGHRGRDDGEA